MYLIRRDMAFGDVMMASLAVTAINDSGIQAALYSFSPDKHLLACPISDPGVHPGWQEHWFQYESFRTEKHTSWVENWLARFGQHIGKDIKLHRRTVPVHFCPIPGTPKYDVVMTTKSGTFTPYRNWPHFGKLKTMLTEEGITWLDMDEQQIYNNECLNLIRKAKVYLGLDTGRSHYVSSEAEGKTIIIQSGNNDKKQWCVYNYEFIERPMTCAPCFLQSGCEYDHECMAEITPEEVMRRVKEKMESRRYSLPFVF